MCSSPTPPCATGTSRCSPPACATHDIANIAGVYARALPQLLSLECWGGATFDVAMRFLTEDPWERLSLVREAAPNILLQMLLRGANGVGYTNYPDNVVRHFVAQAASGGIDLFRVFDCLNWVDNMRVAMDAIVEEGKLCEAAICYTGNILDPDRAKYDLNYYNQPGEGTGGAGAHNHRHQRTWRPAQARRGTRALQGAARGDRFAAALPHPTTPPASRPPRCWPPSRPMSMRWTRPWTPFPVTPRSLALARWSRPSAAPSATPASIPNESAKSRSTGNPCATSTPAFESDLKGPASEVYLHEMPGGQFTNPQGSGAFARPGNPLAHRWRDLSRRQHDVRRHRQGHPLLQGSRRHGADEVSQDLTVADVVNPAKDIAFPDSVISMLRRDLRPVAGRLAGGAAEEGAEREKEPITVRPGSLLADADLDAGRAELKEKLGRDASENTNSPPG